MLLPGASPVYHTHDKVMRRDLMGKENQDSRGPLSEHLPETKSVSLLYVILYSSDITGGYPRQLFS